MRLLCLIICLSFESALAFEPHSSATPAKNISKINTPIGYEELFNGAESIIYGRFTNKVDSLFHKKRELTVLQIQVLRTNKSKLNDRYVYLPLVPGLGRDETYSETERVIIFTEELIDIDGKLLVLPILKRGSANGGVIRLSHTLIFSADRSDARNNALNNLFEEFAKSEEK